MKFLTLFKSFWMEAKQSLSLFTWAKQFGEATVQGSGNGATKTESSCMLQRKHSIKPRTCGNKNVISSWVLLSWRFDNKDRSRHWRTYRRGHWQCQCQQWNAEAWCAVTVAACACTAASAKIRRDQLKTAITSVSHERTRIKKHGFSHENMRCTPMNVFVKCDRHVTQWSN